MNELSIILVNYNTTEDMIECIKSILRSEIKMSYEIIVVDNDSKNQETVVSQIKSAFPGIKLIANKKNVGFAAANNIGIKYAQGKVLLFLNPDIIVDKKAIVRLYNFLKNHPEAGLVGPLTIDSNGKVDYYCGRAFPNLINEILHHSGLSKSFPKNRFLGQGLMTYWDHKTTKEVEAIQGSAMMARMDDILKIGGMDESFFLFCEDTDWCYRFRKIGKKNYLCADALVVHKRHASARGKENLIYTIGITSIYKFILKHYGRLSAIIYRIIIFCIYLVKLIFCIFSSSQKCKLFVLFVLWSLGMSKFVRNSRGHPILKVAGCRFT